MTGVLLLNLGGPDSPEAVKPFLYNLFSDRRIIKLGPAPLQRPLAWLISTRRAPKTIRAYAQIGGGSPIKRITTEQASALESALNNTLESALNEHGKFKVYVGMRYWNPCIEEAVQQAHDDGVKRLLALSLYPQYSAATTGSTDARLKEIMRGYPIEYHSLPAWYTDKKYIEALADTVRQGLLKSPSAEVLFSAHSLPAKLIAGGDPYAAQILATIKSVAEQVPMRWHLGYQSRSGPVKWLGPSTVEVLERLAAEGVSDVFIVPVSFVSDHIETLYEIDILYKDMARKMGITLSRAVALNTHPVFIEALKDMVLKSAKEFNWQDN